jgi:DNA-binding LacI/PurR family transcriptional regulator
MTDVARHAGVSTMTVSNVINGRSQRVSESTKRRVLTVIAELGYQVNLTARNLRMGRTGAVGLAVPAFAPGYYAELADRLADRFAAHGMRLAVERTGGSRVAELDALTAPRLSGYDGFVMSVVAGEVADLDRLSVDTPAEFLIRSGARRIALLGGVSVQEETMPGLRTRGYRDAHEAAGTAIRDELIVSCEFAAHDGYAAVQDLVGRGVRFDAIFALTDSAAIGALRALAESGRRVPEDVQVIGFDNLDDSRFTVPRLTTVEPGNAEMADAICALLVERIESSPAGRAARVVMPEARIVERETTRRQ